VRYQRGQLSALSARTAGALVELLYGEDRCPRECAIQGIRTLLCGGQAPFLYARRSAGGRRACDAGYVLAALLGTGALFIRTLLCGGQVRPGGDGAEWRVRSEATGHCGGAAVAYPYAMREWCRTR
jgi:hypothetical protein